MLLVLYFIVKSAICVETYRREGRAQITSQCSRPPNAAVHIIAIAALYMYRHCCSEMKACRGHIGSKLNHMSWSKLYFIGFKCNCHVSMDIRRNCAERQFTSKKTFRSGSSGSWTLRCLQQFILHSQTLLNILYQCERSE